LRKIYVVLALIIILTVFSFADGWLNAQTEIQKSFKTNSPGTLIQTNQSSKVNFLNVGGSVSALQASSISNYSTSISVSNPGLATIDITLPNNFLPGNGKTWTYEISSISGFGSIKIDNAQVSYDKSGRPNYINMSVSIPQNIPSKAYGGTITITATNSGNDTKVWQGFISLTVNVLQWLKYSLADPASTVISQPGDYSIKLVDLSVSSNATVTVAYTAGLPKWMNTSGLHYESSISASTNMISDPLIWSGTVSYNTPPGKYEIPVTVTISTTTGF
jgi:hypothetical protein